MVALIGTFSRLSRRKVLVVGDLMLDNYTIGKARRISPEAPVAVIQVTREENRPGGAGNVMLNLVSMGTEVVGVGRIGPDASGEHLRKILLDEQIDLSGLVVQYNLCTPVKKRIIADNQQVVRVDYEQVVPLSEDLEQQIIDRLPMLLEGVSVVAISDYGKGFLTDVLLKALIKEARQRQIPVVADPKGSDFSKYNGATIIKPNLSEAYAAAALPVDADLNLVAEKVLKKGDAEMLMVTRSEAGISLFYRNGERKDFPVQARGVKDVTGAGDTVLAMLTCALASQLSIDESIELSNVAAGMAIERFGCARITLSELARRLLDYDAKNKVFDDAHCFALKAALEGGEYILLGLFSHQGLTNAAFAAIRQLSQHEDCDLIIYLMDNPPDMQFVNLLSSLREVKFVILHSNNLYCLFDTLSPKYVYIVQGQETIQLDSLSHLLTEEQQDGIDWTGRRC